mmetsp:Transcript_39348/g.87567  ORF Transcript_39348/g.87567 Transcript_39348/m.87567 type:complete len:106 (-) Transcript_39348:658-975(-)
MAYVHALLLCCLQQQGHIHLCLHLCCPGPAAWPTAAAAAGPAAPAAAPVRPKRSLEEIMSGAGSASGGVTTSGFGAPSGSGGALLPDLNALMAKRMKPAEQPAKQ